MKNDKGCLCCLPSDIAPILVGLANVALLILSLIDFNPYLIAVPVVSLIPVVWTFCDRESACARIVLLLVYIVEAVLFWMFIWMIVALSSSEACYHKVPSCAEAWRNFYIFTGCYVFGQLFMLSALYKYYASAREGSDVYQKL